MLTLIESNDPVLKQIAEPVTKITSEYRDMARMMVDLMKNRRGIGLAAPQIGHSIQMAVVYVKRQQKHPIVMYNPVITNKSDNTEYNSEGCLSFPELFVDVERPVSIEVQYMDGKGKKAKLSAVDLLARCIQHEVDHLHGVTLPDHV